MEFTSVMFKTVEIPGARDVDGKNLVVGDRVESAVDHPDDNRTIITGSLGTIVGYCANRLYVRWDDFLLYGHDCGGRCETGHGWEVRDKQVRSMEEHQYFDPSDEDPLSFFDPDE